MYFAFAAVYSWQASRRPVPTTFTDELELTQLARSIASTGHPSRLGEPYGMASLVAYLLAPIWWLGSTTSAYAAGKLLLVLTMTSAVFPAYGLARMVTPRWYALAAAAASIALPALTYAPFFVEEPLAYPLATLALWLIARLVARPSWGRFAGAFAVCALGALTRTQLAVLFAVLALGLVWLAWESKPALRWRSSWTAWDWAGAVALVLGVVLGFSALMGHLSTSWRNTTFIYKGRILDHATWSLGALAIGMGVLPLVIGVAALARPKDEPRDPETRAFVVVATSALAAFVWYAGIKGAYLSTVFATYVYERNLIYLAPILLAATAMAFARGSRTGMGDRARCGRDRVRRERGSGRAPVPVLRGARPRDPRVREPRARVVGGQDRPRARSSPRSSRSPSQWRSASFAAALRHSSRSRPCRRSSWSPGA